MPKFRKKPVVIEAVELLPTQQSIFQCLCFMKYMQPTDNPIGQDRQYEYIENLIKEGKGIKIKTLESDGETQIASFGDWIIKGVQGEFYPCKDEIFKKTYEPVSIIEDSCNPQSLSNADDIITQIIPLS